MHWAKCLISMIPNRIESSWDLRLNMSAPVSAPQKPIYLDLFPSSTKAILMYGKFNICYHIYIIILDYLVFINQQSLNFLLEIHRTGLQG